MIGLYVGRFQPFHKGHLALVKSALKEVDKLYIVIGSAQESHTERNPFTAGERLLMIMKTLESDGLLDDTIIVPVEDTRANYDWVPKIEAFIPERFDIVYSNEPITSRLFKEKGYEVRGFLYNIRECRGTCIRSMIVKHRPEWIHNVSLEARAVMCACDGIIRIQELSKGENA
jgi:nicotinamide-nucleotide adenylyltransferase